LEPPAPLTTRAEHIFPTLTAAQIARIARHGRARSIEAGAVLVEPGHQNDNFFVLSSGALVAVRRSDTGEDLVASLTPGQFTGETNMLTGRPGLVVIRAVEPSEVIEVSRQELLGLVQTDSELSIIFMRAFILRRVELVAHGFGDVVLLGSSHCSGTLAVKEFLSRNGHPYNYIDLDTAPDVQELLDRFEVADGDIPVVICRGETVLRHPTNEEIADCLGFNESIDPSRVRDVIIVGAGPSGLAAAVYGASEGLDVLILESIAPGGQAGASSRIENYLGFPTGISGQDLAARATSQAEKFGAQMMIAKGAKKLTCEKKPFALEIESGEQLLTRAIIIATGAEYRSLPLDGLSRFRGAGVYHGATYLESQLCRGDEVIVVGGGNSAGQAAVFLAAGATRVHMLVRAKGLAESMSRYLIRRIEQTPSITLHTRCEIEAVEGELHLEQVRWRNVDSGETVSRDIKHIFIMTGAVPATHWLDGCLVLDEHGFIKTGSQLSAEELRAAQWPLPRMPHLLETSRPGVFAVGDVRAGNIKRVASAVGEGAIAVSFVHQVLHE
jgi:thioredoxin reductase (NADPH)